MADSIMIKEVVVAIIESKVCFLSILAMLYLFVIIVVPQVMLLQ